MRDFSTRASQGRRKGSASSAAALAAALLVGAQTALAATAPRETQTAAATGPRPVFSTDAVAAGHEAIELSATLEEGGGLIQLPIRWTITRPTGETVVERSEALLVHPLAPGDYIAAARYGAVRASSHFTIPEAGVVRINFILDAGGLRILPRLKGIAAALPSEARIIPLDGPHKGSLLATYARPGEILRVPAGAYRIESRFLDGNAIASTDVRVRPGYLTAVEFDHIAGLARLKLAGAASARASWHVRDPDGKAVASVEGSEAAVALRPGDYVASVTVAGHVFARQFSISAGETREVLLGDQPATRSLSLGAQR
jgi:hypothetical protein